MLLLPGHGDRSTGNMESMHTVRTAKYLYQAALACGGGPLAIGAIIFLLWLITGEFELVIFGFVLIFPLLIVIGAGLFALMAHVVVAHIDMRAKRDHFWMYTLEAALLLFVNFPVAFCMMLATVMLEAI